MRTTVLRATAGCAAGLALWAVARAADVPWTARVAAAPGTADGADPGQGPGERRVVVTVVDSRTNRPVDGLPAAAFAIREDNLDREVVRVERATGPMSVVLLADTTTAFTGFVRDMRVATASFARTLLTASPASSIALWEFGGADIPIVDFTTDAGSLAQGAAKLFPKGGLSDLGADVALAGAATPRGQNIVASNLLEAVAGASRRLARRAEARRVIVSFNSDQSVEASVLPGQRIQDEVQKAGATWFAVSLMDRAANGPLRDNVMNVLCPLSGGQRSTIVDIAALEGALTNVVAILTSQYLVTYRRPAGAAPLQVLVGIRGEGLRANTPRWAPK